MKFERHYFSEVDKYAISVYKKRFPAAVFLGDIRGIRGADLSGGEGLLTGGFPCQDISVAGKGAGLDGDRSGLWLEYLRLIGELEPAVAVMENVIALVFRRLDRVLGSIAEIGYDAVWQDIRTSDVGAPHRREQIWIVAYPEGAEPEYPRHSREGRLGFADGVETLADTEDNRTVERERELRGDKPPLCEGQNHGEETSLDAFREWWKTEPRVGQMVDGIFHRVDRLKCLGNAIVPQIAKLIFRSMMNKETK
jgi:DNA (cytosine-5)-methyltransferase 1